MMHFFNFVKECDLLDLLRLAGKKALVRGLVTHNPTTNTYKSILGRLHLIDNKLLTANFYLYCILDFSQYIFLVSFPVVFNGSTLPLIRVIDVLKKNILKGDSCARHKHIFSVHISFSELAEKGGGD